MSKTLVKEGKVMANGQWVVENGRYVQGIKPGRVVRYPS